MSDTTLLKSVVGLLAAGTTVAAGSVQRGATDLSTSQGAILTMKIANGATGPSTQCEGRVLIAHNAVATPGMGSAGADWKTVWKFGGGVTPNAITEQVFPVDAAIMHLQVEFIGNTGQAVTVEAVLSVVTKAVTV